jgi:hypothetical protein
MKGGDATSPDLGPGFVVIAVTCLLDGGSLLFYVRRFFRFLGDCLMHLWWEAVAPGSTKYGAWISIQSLWNEFLMSCSLHRRAIRSVRRRSF